jgi:hypothetical protein
MPIPDVDSENWEVSTKARRSSFPHGYNPGMRSLLIGPKVSTLEDTVRQSGKLGRRPFR